MLLLDKESAASDSVRMIAVISPQETVRTEIAQLLRTRGFENVVVINANFFAMDKVTFSAEETIGVIVDIENETDLRTISQQIYSCVPQNVGCCAVGQSDSISLAQRLLNDGILYFHSESQLNQLIDRVISGVNIPLMRNTVRISVLGCKGGIGATLISAHIANEIALNKKVPVLLAQGSNGSQDLDLLFDKKLQGDIVEYGLNLDLFSGDPVRLDNEQMKKYNFVIYDQPIFNVNKENFSPFLEYSNTFVLVVERRISSLRIAKQFLDECERIKNSTGNVFIQEHLGNAITEIKGGKLISKSLENNIIFNSAFINMIAIGESSENLVEILESATEYYDSKINYSVDKILQYLQPVIIIIIASFVAFIVFAIAIPIFDLSNGISIE